MRALLLATLVVAFAGCQKAETSIANVVSAHLERLDDLQNVGPSADRDESYARLAEDACGDGLSDLTHIALHRIESDSLRDTVAFECALLLEKSGATKEASQIARLIRDGDERQSALQQVRIARRK